MNVLEKMNFTDSAVLYFLEDAIDRGKQGIEVDGEAYYLARERIEASETYFDNKTVVFGYTPTYFYQTGIP